MSNIPTTVESLDNLVTTFFSSWSLTSTILILVATTLLLLPLFTARDPDTHPFLLARQSSPSPVRQPGESAVYRALDVPHGYPLRSSLGVRDQGSPKWSQGRRGDLRDVWRRAACGPLREDGVGWDEGKRGELRVVLGREMVEVVAWERGTEMINAVGRSVKGWKSKRMGVCLSNSVELLVCVFASAFYGFEVTLIPYGLDQSALENLLEKAAVDVLVVEAGTVELESAAKSAGGLKQVILVTKGGNKHMDWADAPAGGATVVTFDEIVEKANASKEVPEVEKGSDTPPLSAFIEVGKGEYDLAAYTTENLVSGIAGLGSTLVRDQKLTSSDILLPTSSLTDSYTLCWTLAALYANASIALNSVAGDNIDLGLATAGADPTVVIAAPKTAARYVYDTIKAGGGPSRISGYFGRKSLKAGIMPIRRPTAAVSSLSHLRLILIGQQAALKPKLTSSILHELRVLLGTRVGYAFTTPQVAGAISQTNVNDHRDKGSDSTAGPPLGSVEIYVRGPEDMSISTPRGNIVVKGPSVVGGIVELDVLTRIDKDNTLQMF